MIKVVHVHLIFERKDYYFGSISAIFDNPEEGLTEERLGIKKKYTFTCRFKRRSCHSYPKSNNSTISFN